jgi:hypothetical protein
MLPDLSRILPAQAFRDAETERCFAKNVLFNFSSKASASEVVNGVKYVNQGTQSC